MGATTPSNLVVLHPMMPLGSQRSQVTWQSTQHDRHGELSSGSSLEGGFGTYALPLHRDPSVGLGQRQVVAIPPYFYGIRSRAERRSRHPAPLDV